MPSQSKKASRITSAQRIRQSNQSNITSTKSLLHQYEQLDPVTRQAFNDTFLANLESVKYNMGQLISQHVNKEDSKNAMNAIFPPQYFGFGK